MNIAFILGFFPSLSATFITSQLTGLIDAGHDVRVFALRRAVDQKVHAEIERYRLLDKVSYFNIPENRVRRVLQAAILLVRYFAKGPKPILRSLNWAKYGKDALNLNLFYYALPFLDKKFDVIHAHFGPNGRIGCWLRELGFGGKLLTTFYGADLSSFVRENGSTFYRPVFENTDLLLPICRYFKEKLQNWGCPENKILVHPVGIDLEKFKPGRTQSRAEDHFKILTVARLIEKKGVAYGLRAVAEASRRHGYIQYTVVGYGPEAGRLRALALELGIGRQVEFIGAVDQDEELQLLQQHDLFLLPSVTAASGEEEGTPTVLLEAQAMGLPVVSTRHSGIPEIVIDGTTGFLVAEKDVPALAAKIVFLVENPASAASMGREGRAFMERNFDIRKLNRRLEKIYQDLLLEKRPLSEMNLS